MHISYPPNLSVSELMRKLKGRSGRKLLVEFPELKKRYWGGHLWAIGYGGWSSGNITNEMIDEYLEHHRNPSNADSDDTFILE
jgi:putative transposase